jgi:hypothetical protein
MDVGPPAKKGIFIASCIYTLLACRWINQILLQIYMI